MSELNTIREINTNAKEGRCLIAALAMLGAKRFDKTLDEIYKEVIQLANIIYSDKGK